MTYRVKAPAAVVKAVGTERYLYKGAILPDTVENAEHLLALDLVEKVDEAGHAQRKLATKSKPAQ